MRIPTTYDMTPTELEDLLDTGKIAVLQGLVEEGFLSMDKADQWCASHTILLRKKGLFRTLSNLFSKTKNVVTGKIVLIIVKNVFVPEKKEEEVHMDAKPLSNPLESQKD